MPTLDPRIERLSELSEAAYRLGLAFGAEAERAAEVSRKVEFFQLFERCFFAVRMATALELRLTHAPATASRREVGDRERLERADPPERERTERDADRDADRDRDRDREVERASLPVLLKTLRGVAADAAALPGPEPAALPTLRELLAEMAAPTAPAAAQPAIGGRLRARLTGSAAPAVTILARPLPNPGQAASRPRRSTGPPPR
jgi:hypothetical protein